MTAVLLVEFKLSLYSFSDLRGCLWLCLFLFKVDGAFFPFVLFPFVFVSILIGTYLFYFELLRCLFLIVLYLFLLIVFDYQAE